MQGKKGTKTAKSSAREPTAPQDAGASGTGEGGSNWLSRWKQRQEIHKSYYAAARSGTAAQTAGGKAASNGASAARSGVEQAVEKGKTAVSTAVKGLMNAAKGANALMKNKVIGVCPNCGKVIQQESVKILENIPQAGIGRRRIWEPETLPKDIRLINSHYDDLYRIPDGGVIQVDYPDGRSFTARVEHLDDYHFDMGGLGNVFHICQFAEVMERNHADFYPEIQTQDEQAAWELGGKGYLAIQSCEDGWDYTLYHSDYSVMDGGQLGAPELTIQEAREQILEAHHMEVVYFLGTIIKRVYPLRRSFTQSTTNPVLGFRLRKFLIF